MIGWFLYAICDYASSSEWAVMFDELLKKWPETILVTEVVKRGKNVSDRRINRAM